MTSREIQKCQVVTIVIEGSLSIKEAGKRPASGESRPGIAGPASRRFFRAANLRQGIIQKLFAFFILTP